MNILDKAGPSVSTETPTVDAIPLRFRFLKPATLKKHLRTSLRTFCDSRDMWKLFHGNAIRAERILAREDWAGEANCAWAELHGAVTNIRMFRKLLAKVQP